MSGAEGGAVVADFPLGLEFFQGLENLFLLQGVDPGVVELVEVDVVGVEAAEGLLAGEPDEFGLELLGALLVTDPGSQSVVEVVAELGSDDDIVAVVADVFGEDFLPEPLTVGVGGVEEVDAEIDGVFPARRTSRCREYVPTSWWRRSRLRSRLRKGKGQCGGGCGISWVVKSFYVG